MKNILVLLLLTAFGFLNAQQDSTTVYKKRVLETTEVDFLSTYYAQDGNNASVTGGIGTEELTDLTGTIVVSIPLSADNVLTIDAGFSAYTSASSSNGNPFDISGASGEDDDDDDDDDDRDSASNRIGSPWVTSTGASASDTWVNLGVDYSHSSDDRNTIWNADASFSREYDYSSIGFGGGLTKLFNEKNTTLGVSGKVYLDTWNPIYPTELKAYSDVNGNLNDGFFYGVSIIDQEGNDSTEWSPINGFQSINDKARNSYSVSLSFSQILSKNAQFSVFLDVVKQDGWLGNPLQRVYFSDVDNYYIGNANSISNYTSSSNKDVFHLADDIERLPSSRFKVPFGFRLNYYLNETFVLRTYYRFYSDDWGIQSHTFNLEVPIKISPKFTLYPSYRYYNQTESDYFAPYDSHLSTDEFYTSDYDLSKFNASQYGFGISYTDIFAKTHIWKYGLKTIDFKYNNYQRNTGLSANYVGIGFKFVQD
ncbi:DUF3570 domain-containing protein [Winogradskyella eximia]|uniref:DUF3570 domain-containing protein n=1 Tax=Winogradskyella eximia TaxID=262006 RepID=UPI0024910562|nr:DUF3570 domain-containing protein [Winogradskyella eximia]|tara:strand:+ start:2361 stop:3800 length:1440 start_codon:yes stop_codon:yes gene_type:complete